MPQDRSDSETTQPVSLVDADHPMTRAHRRRRVDRELIRLRRQFLFLFILLVLSMAILSITQQINANRIEYSRYDLCIQRNAEIAAYNAQNVDRVPPFPLPDCGTDPRTD